MGPSGVDHFLEATSLDGGAGLAAVVEAFCRLVPYDTTSKVLGAHADPLAPLWFPDGDELITRAERDRFGASCFPLAGALAELLLALGYDASVRAACGPSTAVEHAVVVIGGEHGTVLCDPAFMTTSPVALGVAGRYGHGASPVWSHGDGRSFTVERGTSREVRTYTLGERLVGDRVREVYEVVGRWATGPGVYRRELVGGGQRTFSSSVAVTKHDDTMDVLERSGESDDDWVALALGDLPTATRAAVVAALAAAAS